MNAHASTETLANMQQEYLISLGHDQSVDPDFEGYIYSPDTSNLGVSINTDGHCPLHLAAKYSRPDCVQLLCTQFPTTVNRADKNGCSPLHLAAGAHVEPRLALGTSRPSKPTSTEDVSVIESLLAHGARLDAHDKKGNTCLHYATAWGNLKAVRALIQAGAVPVSTNREGWQPNSYSLTVQAEVYYKALVTEWEKRMDEGAQRETEQRTTGRSVRLVQSDDPDDDSEQSRSRAGSARSHGTSSTDQGLGISTPTLDPWK